MGMEINQAVARIQERLGRPITADELQIFSDGVTAGMETAHESMVRTAAAIVGTTAVDHTRREMLQRLEAIAMMGRRPE